MSDYLKILQIACMANYDQNGRKSDQLLFALTESEDGQEIYVYNRKWLKMPKIDPDCTEVTN